MNRTLYIKTRANGRSAPTVYHEDRQCSRLQQSGVRPIGPNDDRLNRLRPCKVCGDGVRDEGEYGRSQSYTLLIKESEAER